MNWKEMRIRHLSKQQWIEQAIYLTIWIIVFLLPILGNLYNTYEHYWMPFSWLSVFSSWLTILPFFLLFIINNYLLSTHLLFKKRYALYMLVVILLITGLFSLYPFSRPPHHGETGRPKMERMGARPDMPRPDVNKSDKTFRPEPPRQNDLMIPGIPVVTRIVVAFLLVGFNVAIKLMFKSLHDDQSLKELEGEKLKSELEYLKYQVNPHFFMNTLNNIHALVTIDAKKAQKAIVELSKLMRYVLYEANNASISLSKEIQFLTNYIELMKLRYNVDKVDIQVDFPTFYNDVQIPPLLFVSFIENAFKHGVSYRNNSFVYVSIKSDDDRIVFNCTNSKWIQENNTENKQKGIGLSNIRKRLSLLYGERFSLAIEEKDERYIVSLKIPLS